MLLDIMEYYAAEGQLELDPVWATVALLGTLLFGVMWTRKKLRHRPR